MYHISRILLRHSKHDASKDWKYMLHCYMYMHNIHCKEQENISKRDWKNLSQSSKSTNMNATYGQVHHRIEFLLWCISGVISTFAFFLWINIDISVKSKISAYRSPTMIHDTKIDIYVLCFAIHMEMHICSVAFIMWMLNCDGGSHDLSPYFYHM